VRRHDFCWIDAEADWEALTPDSRARTTRWLQARLPLVVARRDPDVDVAALRLGLALPLVENRQRLGLRVAPQALHRQAPPPPLEEIAASTATAQRQLLRSLHTAAAVAGTTPRVFGSFAWQHLTGLTYLHPGSDIDLLWDVDDAEQAAQVCQRVTLWEQQHPGALRVDGELRFPGGAAVNWREYASGADCLLVKADAGCALLTRVDLHAARQVA